MNTLSHLALAQPASEVVTPSNNCVALIWVKGGLTRRRWRETMTTLLAQPGVESAMPSLAKASLFIVRFDRNRTNALNIIKSLRADGYPAVLVGC